MPFSAGSSGAVMHGFCRSLLFLSQPQLIPARKIRTWVLLIAAAEGALIIIGIWVMRGCRQVWLRVQGGPQGALYPQALVGAI